MEDNPTFFYPSDEDTYARLFQDQPCESCGGPHGLTFLDNHDAWRTLCQVCLSRYMWERISA